MKLASVRNYRLMVWALPVFLIFMARDLLWGRAETVWEHIAAQRSFTARIHRTGVHVRELPEMKGDYERLVRKKMEIASSLLGAKSEAVLYDLLMVKARETGASIISIVPRPERTAEGFTELPLSVEAGGSYDELARFINAIETVGRLMRVEELVMEKDRFGALTATLRLLAYRYIDSVAVDRPKKGKQETKFEKREQYLADLERALAVTIAPPSSGYVFSGKSDPFGSGAVVAAGKRRAGSDTTARKGSFGFSLKGILWKAPPLAILETIDGRTFIVKPGDTVAGVIISSITRNEITVVTPQGSHVLHQYDQK
jgi:Tfp pilus assembly protein PilO